MIEDIKEIIKIPEGIEVRVEGTTVYVKGEKGELYRKLSYSRVSLSKKNDLIELSAKGVNRKIKAVLNTFKAHIKNMIYGVKNGFKYRLKICYSHFPINVEIKGRDVLIKNLLGEKIPRKAKLLDEVSAKVAGDEIIVEGIDIEKVSQSASNIEAACKIKKRDRRVFQDGCWLIKERGQK